MAGAPRVAAVVVDYRSGVHLASCVRSLLAGGAAQVAVVANYSAEDTHSVLDPAGLSVTVVDPKANLGYGAGVNRGAAATPASDYVLVANPDLELHDEALGSMVHALEANPSWGIVGPTILDTDGKRYPSVRRFPSMVDAAGHAVLSIFTNNNPFSRRYRSPAAAEGEETGVDWVSGACMLIRRDAFEQVGGFDERYFMFAEDMDICWRLGKAGWQVGVAPSAVVTHVEGVSRRSRPYAMLRAHHRSALRFFITTHTGWRRLFIPLAAFALGLRLVATSILAALRTR